MNKQHENQQLDGQGKIGFFWILNNLGLEIRE